MAREITYMDGTDVRVQRLTGSADVAKVSRRLAASGCTILKLNRI